jgi:hypothetical protein
MPAKTTSAAVLTETRLDSGIIKAATKRQLLSDRALALGRSFVNGVQLSDRALALGPTQLPADHSGTGG